MASKISIVGAGGFIGNNLTKRLSELSYQLELFDRTNQIIIDKKLSPRAIDSDVIIWCASTVTPISADINPELASLELAYWQDFLRLLSSVRRPELRVYFLSSGGCTYTGSKIPFSEIDIANGTNVYGRLKLEMESTLSHSVIDSIILRIANVYGPNQPSGRGQGVIAEWVNSISRNEPITMYGDVESFRDYIFIDDLLEVIVSLLNSSIKNHKFNVGSGQATTLRELKGLFGEISKVEILSSNTVTRSIDRPGYVLDISKVNKMLAWTPKYTLEKGLRHCLK
jgi:UDP-glucose 4-epimerase